MKITNTRVSVFEVELDLSNWEYKSTSDHPGFAGHLEKQIPTLAKHKCMPGEEYGFITEVKKGTNFAHVAEHILLELINLSQPNNDSFKGWTRKVNNDIYLIHYSAPDFITARIAAIISIYLVKKLLNSQEIEIKKYVDILQNPVEYFTMEEELAGFVSYLSEPISVMQDLEDNMILPSKTRFDGEKEINILNIWEDHEVEFASVSEKWRRAFLEYSGKFGFTIINKLELLNLINFIPLLKDIGYQKTFNGIRQVARLISSYRIPQHFVRYSTSIYKNFLLEIIIETYKDNNKVLFQAIKDFEELYQIIFRGITAGYSNVKSNGNHLELTEFKELSREDGKILVIDDDSMLRSMMSDILEQQGFETYPVGNGIDALRYFVKMADEISLAIIDLNMPDIGGLEVCEEILKLRPHLKVLLISGYPVNLEKVLIPTIENVKFVKKPFAFEALTTEVKQLLEGTGKGEKY